MFTNDDLWLVIRFLGLSHEPIIVVGLETRLQEIESTPALEPILNQVKSDLKDLVSLDVSLQKVLGITKADVVEFDAKLRGMGLITRSIQLIRRIAKNVGVEPDLSILHEMYGGISGDNSPMTINKVRD
jgi:hypothetical protein